MESSEFKSGSVVKELQDTLRNEVDQMEYVIYVQMKELFVMTLRFALQREHGGSSSRSRQTNLANISYEQIATVSPT